MSQIEKLEATWELKRVKRKKLPPRVVIIGEPKIGKSTVASNAPKCVFIPTEDGVSGLEVMQLPSDRVCTTWEDVIQALTVLLKTEHDRKWVVLDTIGGVWDLCAKHVCDRDFAGCWESRKGQEGFNAWARGDKATAIEFKRLLNGLDKLRTEKEMGCLLLGHEGLHKFNNTNGEDFQTTGAYMGKASWQLLRAWADQIGHACRDYIVTKDQGLGAKGKAVAVNNTRWLIFDGGPGRDAGARAGYDMPDKIELNWSVYSDHLSKNFKKSGDK
jgi:hypothetical protein